MNEQLEIRTKDHGVEVVGVSFPQRTIELVVMPYEHPTQIHEPGRSYEEVVSRGAFDGVEARNGRVRVNRDHDVTRVVGRVVAFHPSREDGLVAELKISDTVIGRDTLTDANDGNLDASAGFMLMRKNGSSGPVVDGAETWESRSRRRLNKLWLGHVALTAEPAYETAKILDVRKHSGPQLGINLSQATPNRDRLKLDELRRLYAEMNLRYSAR